MDAALVDEIRCWLDAHVEHIQAIIVRGSFARGEQTPYSDVDIGCYVPEPYEPVKHFLQLQGRLVEISVKTLAHERAAIQQPERAVFAVPDLRAAMILYDSTGAFRDFQRELQRFEWTPLQPAADQHASWTLMRLSEHARKVLSGLSKNDPLSSVSVVAVLSVALCDVLGVQRGLLAQCGITYSAQVQTSVGVHSRWTFWYRLLVGAEPMTSGVSIARMRSLAALHLYEETVRLLWPIIRPEHRIIVEPTLQAIEAMLEEEVNRGGRASLLVSHKSPLDG